MAKHRVDIIIQGYDRARAEFARARTGLTQVGMIFQSFDKASAEFLMGRSGSEETTGISKSYKPKENKNFWRTKMPLALEPGAKFKIVLKSDEEKPKDKQPYFEFRYLSAREWKEIAAMSDKLDSVTGAEEAINKLFEILRRGLCGWGNMGVEYDPLKFEDMVTLNEANEILFKFRNQGMTATERKNFD